MTTDYKEAINYYAKVLLPETGAREGMREVLKKLKEIGFFTAPASSVFHLNVPGGLAAHSISVYEVAMRLKTVVVEMRPELEERLSDESIAIAALLHDVCKSQVYKPVRKRRKDPDGCWRDYDGYDVDYHDFPMGHGEKSVIMLLMYGLKLTEDEMVAIRWHMSAWDLPFQSAEEKSSLNAAKEKCPLLTLLQCADGMSAGMLESPS